MISLRGIWERLALFDWILLIVALALVGFGLVELYSLGVNADPADLSRFTRQMIAVGIGVVLIVALAVLNYRLLGNIAVVLYGVGLLALGAVLAFGVEIRGTTGWLSVGGFSIQPVELVKLLLIVYLARFFSDRSERMHQWKNIAYACVIGGVPAALVLLQPDLGSALMVVAIWLGMLLISGIKRWQFGLVVALMVGLAVVAFFGFLTSEQKSRLLVFVNCETSECKLGVGYNVEQSITAIGSGQLSGRGLGLGSQSQLDFLPEQETDFIFAVIAEEFGFLGSATVVVLIATVLFRIARTASMVRDDFAVFLCWGIFMYIFVQSVINIGMNLGLAPVTGLPLPLISAGGTSVLAVLAGLGVVESVVLRRNQLG